MTTSRESGRRWSSAARARESTAPGDPRRDATPCAACAPVAGGAGRAFLRRSICGWLLGNLRVARPSTPGLFAGLSAWLTRPGDLLRIAVPGPSARAAWLEFRNKLAAFRLFAEADAGAGMRAGARYRLADLVSAVEALGPYGGLWTTEGVGYYHATGLLADDPDVRGILSAEAVRAVPARWLIPLHTGLGLAMAGQFLDANAVDARAPQIDPHGVVESYLGRVRANALEGYTGACVESLGLMVALLRPDLVPVLDRGWSGVGGDLRARFWHGYGRGLYFSPANVLPCTGALWPAEGRAATEPPDESARANAAAGLAWAVTLVNIRDPEVVAAFLGARGQAALDPDAIADGIRSAAAVWMDWDPGSGYLKAFCAYEPADVPGGLAGRWARATRGPCGEDFARDYSRLRSQNRLDDLFRYPSAAPTGSRSQ